VDCARPLLRVCVRLGCGFQQFLPCKSPRSSVCGECSIRYRRRVQCIAKSGLGRDGFFEYFLTLTPPGDRQHCKKPGCDQAPYCSHEQCECTGLDGTDLARWNAQHGARFNHFRTRLRRELAPDLQYMRGCEAQDGKHLQAADVGRMGLHDHLVMRTKHPLDVRDIRALAMAAGFGHSVKLVPIRAGSRAEAYYISKYITKSSDVRADVPWVADVIDVETGELFEGVRVPGRYRTWSMSRDWGLSMADVRASAYELYLRLDAARCHEEISAGMSVLTSGLGGDLILPGQSPPLPA